MKLFEYSNILRSSYWIVNVFYIKKGDKVSEGIYIRFRICWFGNGRLLF